MGLDLIAKSAEAPTGLSVLDLFSAALIGAGLLFFLGASVGIVRFPDFYTRMHAAGKGDTLSTVLITAGMAVHVLDDFDLAHWTVVLVALKVLAIGLFIMLTSPTSTHALMQAGYDDGIEPITKGGRRGIRDLGGPFLDGFAAAAEPSIPTGGEARATAARKRTSKKAAKRARTTKKAARKKTATKKVAKKAASKKATKKVAKKTSSKRTTKKKSARRKTPGQGEN